MNLDNIIMESNFQVVILSIMDNIGTPKQISNLVNESNLLLRVLRLLSFLNIIFFFYFNITVNSLTDRIKKKKLIAFCNDIQFSFWLNIVISFSFFRNKIDNKKRKQMDENKLNDLQWHVSLKWPDLPKHFKYKTAVLLAARSIIDTYI